MGYTMLTMVRARLGFSPYDADFKDLHTWVMIEYESSHSLKPYHTLTLVRLFKGHYLMELGIGPRSFLAVMVHFGRFVMKLLLIFFLCVMPLGVVGSQSLQLIVEDYSTASVQAIQMCLLKILMYQQLMLLMISTCCKLIYPPVYRANKSWIV